MTLPKKKSRSIEVNGKTFRWMVKRAGPKEDGRARLTVENPETGEIKQRYFRGWASGVTSLGEPTSDPPAVTPGDVKGFIIECWF